MKLPKIILVGLIFLLWRYSHAQEIADFTSLPPGGQDTDFHIPATHQFQYLVMKGESMDDGNIFPGAFDFTGYFPINGSSQLGILTLNHENTPGGVSIMDMDFNVNELKWYISNSSAVDFTPVNYIQRPCSGAITPWNTLIACEEATSGDSNGDGYNEVGWAIEIDPVSRTLIDQPGGLSGGDKLWAMGNFKHENAAVHPNQRTVYQGADSNPGYLYKFVATTAGDLSSGDLFVYVDLTGDTGNWVQVPNSTQADQNNTLSFSSALGGRVFNAIEDVEINPFNGKVYVAVKNEHQVYRFDDSSLLVGGTVSNFEKFVGDRNYDIDTGAGIVSEPWGTGNDNLAFDGEGNLWVLQDGSKNYIWVVRAGHTEVNPMVDIFGRTPSGSEPTGITFTPDFKYLFMSLQHPSAANNTSVQLDAFGENIHFDNDIAIVIARDENLGPLFLSGEPLGLFGELVDTDANLRWETGNPLDTDHFVLEKSIDGTTWNELDVIEADGKTAYERVDESIELGTIYYRVTAFFKNETSFNSDIIALEREGAEFPNYLIYPNPVSDVLIIEGLGVADLEFPIRVIGSDGSIYSPRTKTIGSHKIELNLIGLDPGIFIIEFINGDKKVSQKILKL